jgi:hypothetical protein
MTETSDSLGGVNPWKYNGVDIRHLDRSPAQNVSGEAKRSVVFHVRTGEVPSAGGKLGHEP